MKRLVICGLLLGGFILTAAAQGIDQFFDNDKVRQELSLTDKEVADLTMIWDDSQKQIQVLSADRQIKSAELKRLLLEERVNMAAVQKALRDATDLEYKQRLAEIERMVKAKEILGEARWAELQRLMRGMAMMRRGQDRDGPGRDRPPRNMTPPRDLK